MTPKAGLLAMLAASCARVPIRFHTFMGEVWATRAGLARLLLKLMDGLTARLSTDVFIVSRSERAFLRREHILGQHEGRVLGSGSVAGVDLDRFAPDERARAEVRHELEIDPRSVVFLFVGRINRDKGIVVSRERVATDRIGLATLATLLVVGEDEDGLTPLFAGLERTIVLGYSTFPNATSMRPTSSAYRARGKDSVWSFSKRRVRDCLPSRLGSMG